MFCTMHSNPRIVPMISTTTAVKAGVLFKRNTTHNIRAGKRYNDIKYTIDRIKILTLPSVIA